MAKTIITANEFNELYSKFIKGQNIRYYNPEHKGMKYYDNVYMFDSSNKGYYREVIFKEFPVIQGKKVARLNKHFIINMWGDTAPNIPKKNIGRDAIKQLKSYCSIYKEEFEYKNNKDYVIYGDDEKDIVANMYNYLNKDIPRDTWIEHCYGYDMNSCYPSFLDKPLPHGDIIARDRIVQEDEIGFVNDITDTLDKTFTLCLPGEYAEIIFKSKIYEGFKDYATSEFKRKKQASKDDYEDTKAKYNAMLGNMKYHNIFIRIAVLGYAYRFMESLRDENTIMQTVDSIVSLKPRTDLNIGEDLGQFKEEHTDEPFIFKSHGVKKWFNSKTSYKGMLRDSIEGNYVYKDPLYYFDDVSRKFKKTKKRRKERLWPELKNIKSTQKK